MRDAVRPTRRNRAARLDDAVYGHSGYPCHLNVRTHRGERIFTRRPDLAQVVWEMLPRVADDSGVGLYAYCLMPNHLHLVAAVEREGGHLRTFVSSLKAQVTRRVRATFAGPLWQSGFYDHVLRADEDLLTVCRYILNNPVRWGLTEPGGEYGYCWLSPLIGAADRESAQPPGK